MRKLLETVGGGVVTSGIEYGTRASLYTSIAEGGGGEGDGGGGGGGGGGSGDTSRLKRLCP